MRWGLSTLFLAPEDESACDRKEPRGERCLRVVDVFWTINLISAAVRIENRV